MAITVTKSNKMVESNYYHNKIKKLRETKENRPLRGGVQLYGDIYEYVPWENAIDTYNEIKDADKLEELSLYMAKKYPNGCTISKLNDMLSFHSEEVLKALNINNDGSYDDSHLDESLLKEDKDFLQSLSIEDLESVDGYLKAFEKEVLPSIAEANLDKWYCYSIYVDANYKSPFNGKEYIYASVSLNQGIRNTGDTPQEALSNPSRFVKGFNNYTVIGDTVSTIKNDTDIGVEILKGGNNKNWDYIVFIVMKPRKKSSEPYYFESLKRIKEDFEPVQINGIDLSGEFGFVGTDLEINPPKSDEEIGVSKVISDLIKDEFEAIDGYNSAIATLSSIGYAELTAVLQDIINEENVHIGQLESIMQVISKSDVDNIEKGKVEGEEQLNQ